MKTLADITRTHAAERPDKVALICNERSLTYGELDTECNQVANALIAATVASSLAQPVCRPGWMPCGHGVACRGLNDLMWRQWHSSRAPAPSIYGGAVSAPSSLSTFRLRLSWP